jgi:hypothetical protein
MLETMLLFLEGGCNDPDLGRSGVAAYLSRGVV